MTLNLSVIPLFAFDAAMVLFRCQSEVHAYMKMKELFTSDICRFMIVVFTHMDHLEPPPGMFIKQYVLALLLLLSNV